MNASNRGIFLPRPVHVRASANVLRPSAAVIPVGFSRSEGWTSLIVACQKARHLQELKESQVEQHLRKDKSNTNLPTTEKENRSNQKSHLCSLPPVFGDVGFAGVAASVADNRERIT